MAELTDHAKQAFASATDWSKQILTLSTGILTLTISFADKIFGDLSNGEKWLLWIAWVLYIVSIIGGVWMLSALTGKLGGANPPVASDVYGSSTRRPAFLQLAAFVTATIVLVIFGFVSAGNQKTPDQPKAALSSTA